MRKVIILLCAAGLLALAFIAVLVYLASPGPATQEILGVGIGDYHADAGIVYLSGRRMDCTHDQGELSYSSVCTVQLAGKTLKIRARRNPPTDPNQLSGTCEASYDGARWPCHVGSRHVDVHWFAFIGDAPGLERAQIEALRRRFFIENLPEETFTTMLVVIPVGAAMMAILASGAWLWPKLRHRASYTLVVVASGATTLVIAFLLSLYLTRGFWD